MVAVYIIDERDIFEHVTSINVTNSQMYFFAGKAFNNAIVYCNMFLTVTILLSEHETYKSPINNDI